MRIKQAALLATAIVTFSLSASAQVTDTSASSEDLLAMLDEGAEKKKEYTTATFKATRIINGHSIENVGKGVLDFRILHRFGALNQGVKNFFGLDNANTKLAFDYGLTDWLMIGLARGTYEKEFDGYVKARILRQTNDNRMPFSLSYLGGMYVHTIDVPVPAGTEYFFSNRLAFANQLLIARKFSNWFSLQLTPTHIHYNLVPTSVEPNDVLAVGIGGRIKLNNRLALTGEYFYTIPGANLNGYHNSLSVGLDIETGGHVFQLMFTNSIAMTERTFIGQTTGDWAKGDIHFGFNISRVFTIVKPKGFENSRNKIY
jgi:hypothetical protein